MPRPGETSLPGELPAVQGWQPGEAPPRPLAVFTGRRLLLTVDEVRIELLQGRLHAVAGEAPVLRLRLSGAPAAVLGLARSLAADLPLLPAALPLAEMAWALAHGVPPRPRRQGAPSLAAAETVGDGWHATIIHLLDVLLAEAMNARIEAGPRGVHQSRVALRRLRSAIKLFRPALGAAAPRDWDAMLAAIARVFGEARDWDVFLEGTVAPLRAALPSERRFARLARAAREVQAAAYARIAEMLTSPAFRDAIWWGMQMAHPSSVAVEAVEALAAPIRPYGARMLQRRWKRLRRAGEGIEELSPEALHHLRLDVKRFRYAMELFGALSNEKASARFLKRLAALQEALGLANDAEVARGLGASLARVSQFAVGAVAGFSLGRAADSRDLTLRRWPKILESKKFWSKNLPKTPL
jgi:CHAD domain-containing protein